MESCYDASCNPLQHIHHQLVELPQSVRSRICEECNWSLPTYYRKVKGGDISNAEKEKIISIIFERLQQAWEDCKNNNGLPPDVIVAQ